MFGLGVLGNLGLVGGGGVPSWVPVADGFPADLAFDFTQNLAWARSTGALSTATSLLTCSRAISGTGHTYDYAANSLGVYSGFLANVPRMTDLGLLVEESRVNIVLNNRDLTQGTWTPSNITAAKDQVGVDGAANSASSIAATAGNGTILGATTVSSSARWQTAFVKRLVGSGTIQMTMDNGSTWTTVTVTSSWSRVSIPTQTLANPTVGFKIVASGDKIAVDFVQNEASATFATSPIATTSAAVTRSADVVTVTSAPSSATSNSIYLSANIAQVNGGVSWRLLELDGGTSPDEIIRCDGSSQFIAQLGAAGIATGPTITIGGHKFASRFVPNNLGFSVDGASPVIDTSTGSVTPTRITIGGSTLTASRQCNSFVRQFAYWASRGITDAGLRGLTT